VSERRIRTGYELAVKDVTATFDPLPLKPILEPDPRVWLLESEAARFLGLSKKALERRRSRGTGPLHHQRMGLTAYYVDDLDAWVASKPKAYRPPSE
jgi:hypothetical protein